MALQVSRAAPFARLREPLAQLRHERRHPVAIRRVLGAICADARLNALHQKKKETNEALPATAVGPVHLGLAATLADHGRLRRFAAPASQAGHRHPEASSVSNT